MAIVNRHIAPPGLGPEALGFAVPVPLGLPKVSASNAVYTRASVFSASSVNSTVAPGTGVDFPRNLVYRFTPSTGSAGLYSGGTIVIVGSDIRKQAITETIAMTLLNTSTQIVGSKAFMSVGTISFSNCTLHTASSSASSDVSFHLGVGNRIGLPFSVRSTNGVAGVWLGTAIQNATHTVHSGNVPIAALELSAFASASAVNVIFHLSR